MNKKFNNFLPKIIIIITTWIIIHTFTIRGGSRKKIAKKIIPKVPTNS